ncbi:chemotaxis protein CheX [Burkholderia cenocepacia]|uniref:chemotaxis protein CheX n=1 Tax=Burkholderia cenocepacia TaxID=95486 RepID=UPI0009821602|nr:chemotaxis protein CheX [Burkholderia cenocepacia]AQQ24664.1 chemotaxis protein CheX [Burkholderia cenocepacia]ONV82502.1 chemotaxis protein CheX [Burkholderia cenocepacia]ONW06515.1 chemotaxis protein CheX [Burkholderia cenocepacia]ONW11414.1 chemotaxis protein CheX [Burkholderia cenocepacia]ONW32895.1 chemotaxis protein CheX [Burkholderia cenocepacia]
MTKDQPVSKVLVLDDSRVHADAIKRFCDARNLVGLTVRRSRLLKVLRSNIDLGAILLAEDYGGSPAESAIIATQIDALRPELPIILRRESLASRDGLPDALARVACAAYVADDMTPLERAIDEYLFGRDYPNALVRGISEITEARIDSLFPGMTIEHDTPCIVRDQIIFGEVFSLIALESAWCRGYMLLQTSEQPLLDMLGGTRDGDGGRAPDFRDVNSVLGELTNLVWGAFKNRYLGDAEALARHPVQVPLVVNHKQKFISFGGDCPQLCFKYRMTDPASGRSVRLDQRFVFSLSWSPEDFRESVQDVGPMVEAGELELF